MSKRIKSGLMSAASLLGAAFLVTVFTPQWSDFLIYLKDSAAHLGIPAAIIGVLGVFLGEVLRAIINRIKIQNVASSYGRAASSIRREMGDGLDLY